MGLLQQQHAEHKARQRRLYHSTVKPLLAMSPAERREIGRPTPVPQELSPEIASYKTRQAQLKAIRADLRLLNAKIVQAGALESIPPPTHSVRTIVLTVARYYGIRMTGMLSRCRHTTIVRPRQIAQYLCCQLTRRSLPEIGRFFGMDHTSVLNARWRINDLRKEDVRLDFDIKQLTSMLALPDGEEPEDLPAFLPVRAA